MVNINGMKKLGEKMNQEKLLFSRCGKIFSFQVDKALTLIGFFLFLSCFLLTENSVCAWSYHTHRKIAADALYRMPAFFQKRFFQFKETILRGSTDPDMLLKDFQNHYYNVHTRRKSQEAPGYIRDMFESISGKIRRSESDEDIARWLGLLSHYVGDLNQPLHTDGDEVDPTEDTYHSKFEKEVEGNLSKIKVASITFNPVAKPVERVMEMVEAANPFYGDIGKAYGSGNRIFDLMPMVTRQYNAAVNHVVDFWLGVFKESGANLDLSQTNFASLPPEVQLELSAPMVVANESGVSVLSPGVELVDINTASADQLRTIPGVGEKKAKSIIENRPYKSIYDLARVKGFGAKLVERISDRITVGTK